jgi:hypothetical protein
MTVKQLGCARCQVVQKPVALSFHVPVLFEPDSHVRFAPKACHKRTNAVQQISSGISRIFAVFS